MLEACAKVMAGICWTAWDQALWEAGCKCHQAGCRRDASCVIPSEGYQYRYSFFIVSSSLDQRPWAPVCPSLSLGVPPLSWMAWSPFIHNTVGKRRVGGADSSQHWQQGTALWHYKPQVPGSDDQSLGCCDKTWQFTSWHCLQSGSKILYNTDLFVTAVFQRFYFPLHYFGHYEKIWL